MQDAFWGILIPFLGTSLGAGCVFFLKKSLSDGIQRALTGFAACFCCCWIILFRICTRIVCRPKGQKANSNAPL